MIHTEQFAKRLQLVFDYYEISAAEFADRIDVQRSSISHILSGRNKPSLDFILKVLRTFSEIDFHWLVNGKGSFPKVEQKEKVIQKNELTPTLFSNSEESISSVKNIEISDTSKSSKYSVPEFEEIDRIVIFYKNGSFKSYYENE